MDPDATPALRPTRRTAIAGLLGGTGVLGLALSGCDRTGGTDDASTAPAVELTAMTTDPSLIAEQAPRHSWGLVAMVPGRPAGMIIATTTKSELTAFAVTPDHPEGIDLSVDPATRSLTTDGGSPSVRVLAERAEKGKQVFDLFVSGDMATWSSAPVADLSGTVLLHQMGLLVTSRTEKGATRVVVSSLADDATLAQLGEVPVPDGEDWSVTGAAATDSALMLAIRRTGDDVDFSEGAITSTDGGKTWSSPVSITAEGDMEVTGLVVQAGTFVAVGTRQADASGGAGRFAIPCAWRSADGTSFTQENPALTLEGYDMVLGVPSVLDEQLILPVGLMDGSLRAVRDAQGGWTWSDPVSAGEEIIDQLVAAGDADVAVVGSGARILDRTSGAVTAGLPLSPKRSVAVSGFAASRHGGGTISWTVSSVQHVEDGWSAQIGPERILFRIDGAQLVPITDLPAEVADQREPWLLTADDGRSLILGEAGTTSEDRAATPAWAESEDGSGWAPVQGLPTDVVLTARRLRRVDSTYYLCGYSNASTDIADRQRSKGVLLSSPDLVTWTDAGGFPDVSEAKDIASADGTLVAVGTVGNGEDAQGALFRKEGESWKPTPVKGTSEVGAILAVDGGTRAYGVTSANRWIEWTVDGDAVLTKTSESTREESRQMVLDLGDGVLATAGGRRVDGIWQNVLWTSVDHGKNWGATPISADDRLAGRVDAQLDGKDVVVVVGFPDAPYAWRATGLAAQLTGKQG